jgi:hypothetical protein
MSIKSGPRIVTNGLIFDIDAASSKTYSGTGLTANGLIAGLSATLVNGVGFSSLNNGFFIFDGTNDYITAGNDASVQISSGTISAWARTSSPGGSFRGIVAKQGAYGLFYADNVLVSYDWNTGSTRSTGLNIADNTWKNVVMTFQSGVSNGTFIYLNGVSVLTTTITIQSQAANLFVGAEANAGQYAACNIAQALVYNRALSNQEILQNYNATKKRYV